jgi:hypothetical protein
MATTGIGAQATVPSGRPGWLTFFAITAIVLGVLTALAVASELGNEKLMNAQTAFLEKSGADGPLRDMQLDMQARMAAAMREGRPFLRALAPLGLLTAAGMIIGGIGCLQLRRRARPLLLAALALGLVYEGARAKPVLERQLAVTKATQTSMTQMIDSLGKRAAPGDSPGARSPETIQRFMGTAMSFATLAGMATALAMMILKLAFLIAGVVYLTRPRVRVLFG